MVRGRVLEGCHCYLLRGERIWERIERIERLFGTNCGSTRGKHFSVPRRRIIICSSFQARKYQVRGAKTKFSYCCCMHMILMSLCHEISYHVRCELWVWVLWCCMIGILNQLYVWCIFALYMLLLCKLGIFGGHIVSKLCSYVCCIVFKWLVWIGVCFGHACWSCVRKQCRSLQFSLKRARLY